MLLIFLDSCIVNANNTSAYGAGQSMRPKNARIHPTAQLSSRTINVAQECQEPHAYAHDDAESRVHAGLQKRVRRVAGHLDCSAACLPPWTVKEDEPPEGQGREQCEQWQGQVQGDQSGGQDGSRGELLGLEQGPVCS